jgi:hypothetical protein
VLDILLPEREYFNEEQQEFIKVKSEVIQLEHSLVSLSKWESKWCKPFLGKEEKTNEETLDYIRCMTVTKNIDSSVYAGLPETIFEQIANYINAPMTATWFNEHQGSKKRSEVITAEIIYYWMISQNIPMECQKWHLNRLLTLIRVCSLKNQPPKKMGRKEMLSNRRALNEARRSQLNTRG